MKANLQSLLISVHTCMSKRHGPGLHIRNLLLMLQMSPPDHLSASFPICSDQARDPSSGASILFFVVYLWMYF